MTKEEIEAVARAFYESLDEARGWEREPAILKERLRRRARIAIAAIDEYEADAPLKVEPLIVSGPLEAARTYLMESESVSILPGSSFRAILRGTAHTFALANHDYFKLVGHRDLLDMPIRAALPELAGQGYYELLDRVFAAKQTFMGQMLPVKLQPKPSGPLEEHHIDLVYRPIENQEGEVLGLFVEGYDHTQ